VQYLGNVNSQAKNAAPPLSTKGMVRFLEPGWYANPIAFIVASLCTLVQLLVKIYDERDHVDEGFAHYLHDRRTFPGDKEVVLDRVAINDGTIFWFLLVITMAMRNGWQNTVQ
jgi:hypothetical protein